MTPEDVKAIEGKDVARPIRVFVAQKPTKHCGTLCHACLAEDYSVDLQMLRERMSGQKCISICCRPVAEGHFCVKHGMPLIKKVQEYINIKANEALQEIQEE